MTKDETIAAMAQVLAGLQVPVALGMRLGTAREPWERLHNMLPSGWHQTEEYEAALREVLA